MEFGVWTKSLATLGVECLVLGVFEEGELSGEARSVDNACGGRLKKLLDRGDFAGRAGDTLLVAIGVGVLAALVVVAVRRLAGPLDARARRRADLPIVLVLGGLAVGLLAQTADWLGADSQDVLFSGQASVPDLVASDSTKIVLILFVAKGIAYAVSLGCGFRGGPVFPAIFLGIALATFTSVWFDVSPTLAVAVGTAAGTAAVTRLLVTSSLFAALLVGPEGTDAVPAAVLAACAAWLVIQAADRLKASATLDVVS